MFHLEGFPAFRRLGIVCVASLLVLLSGANGLSRGAIAAPGTVTEQAGLRAQNVDWMPAEMAASLDLGFAVLVPTYIPSPFSNLPAVNASGGYYSLYWMAGGGSPTFLEITGTVGGSLPAGSPADLNNELSINASVQGYDAIHDVTDIYDAVWWIAGGVLYEVNALNISVDSLTLANSLVTLVPPTAPTEPPSPTEESEEPEPTATQAPAESTESAAGATETPSVGGAQSAEPTEENTPSPTVASAVGALSAPAQVTGGDTVTISVQGAEAADLLASAGSFTSNGGNGIVDVQDGNIGWQAPVVDTETTVTISLLVSATGEEVDSIAITVVPRPKGEPLRGSDGTDGPPHPDVVGDGTGGPLAVTVPRPPTPES